MTLFTAAAVAAVAMLTTGCLSLGNASTSFNLPVLTMVAASVGLSTSLESTGAAAALAAAILDLFSRFGGLGILYGIAASTMIVSSMVTNVTAVSLLFPIVQSLIASGGVSAYAAIYVLMVGGSLSFATPVAYSTNSIINERGGYHFVDWYVMLKLVVVEVWWASKQGKCNWLRTSWVMSLVRERA